MIAEHTIKRKVLYAEVEPDFYKVFAQAAIDRDVSRATLIRQVLGNWLRENDYDIPEGE